jgi:hypothetical protein
MKLQHTVFLWNSKGTKFFRTFTIGDVDLKHFDSDFVVDGAVHLEYRLADNEKAIVYLIAIIKNVMSQGYEYSDFHNHMLGIQGYGKALDILRKEQALLRTNFT